MGCVGVCVGSGYLAGAVGDERGVEVPVAALEVTRLRFGFWDRQGGCGGLRVYVSGLSVSPIPPYIYTHMHTHKAHSLSVRLSLSPISPPYIHTHKTHTTIPQQTSKRTWKREKATPTFKSISCRASTESASFRFGSPSLWFGLCVVWWVGVD